MSLSRRDFLQSAAVASLGAFAAGCTSRPPAYEEEGWDAGIVRHVLPGARHDRILVKTSFAEPFDAPPRLRIGARDALGRAVGETGRFFTFDQRGLEPDTAYELRLIDAAGRPLADPWSLRTLPHPRSAPERLRILCFTCAGGPELTNPLSGEDVFLPLAARRRLLARGLAFKPDLAIANGDHVYWDLRAGGAKWINTGVLGWLRAGLFDRDAPVLGHANEDVLHRAFGPQIADLYGTLFRSVPTFFLRDDHDYGENDEPEVFPADGFMHALANATQALYYPELIADETLPARFVGNRGLCLRHGRLRYGDLFESLLYDCRGDLSRGPRPEDATFVPADLEAWLRRAMATSDARHLVQMPSTPILWSAGKWGEWYPDVRAERGVLTTERPKPGWPEGWRRQHDRLVRAAAARSDRIPMWVSGDLHSTAIGEIVETGGERLPQPVVSVLAGTLGTSGPGWPSAFRGTIARPSTTVTANEWLEPLEENGFTLLDVTRDAMVVSQFRWTPEMGLDAIARLEPFLVREIDRPRA